MFLSAGIPGPINNPFLISLHNIKILHRSVVIEHNFNFLTGVDILTGTGGGI